MTVRAMKGTAVGPVILVAAIACLCFFAVSARAEVGGLDSSFGEGGIVTSPLEGNGGGAVALGVGPDGSSVVGSSRGSYLLRFGPQGAPDLGFGAGGKLSLTPDPIGEGIAERSLQLNSFAVDGAGRLLLFGAQSDGRHVFSIPRTMENQTTVESEAVAMRFDPEGKLDPTFGAGGFVKSTFGLRSPFRDQIPQASALVGAVDSRNRPVFVAGTAAIELGCHAGAVTSFPGAVVRLTEAGLPDPTFGTDGLAPIGGSTAAPQLAVDAKGGLALGLGPYPHPELNCRAGTALARLGASGRPLGSFGPHGIATYGRNLKLDFVTPSGAMVLSHQSDRTLQIVRVGRSGRPDRGFGGGEAKVRLPAQTGLGLGPVGVDVEGRVILAGYLGGKGPYPVLAPKHPKPATLLVARLTADGNLDRSFGQGGWIRDRVPGSLEVGATAATIDPEGRLLVAASIAKPGQSGSGYLLARFRLR